MKWLWLGAMFLVTGLPAVAYANTDEATTWLEKGNTYFDRAGTTYGKASERDYANAEIWWLKAAEAGNAEAQYRLANRYMEFRDQANDALAWYLRAAESGHTGAMIALGEIYAEGNAGQTVDFRQTERWWRQAAEHGNAEAEMLLGQLYRGKALGEPDYAQALTWYLRSADHGWEPSVRWACRNLLRIDAQAAVPYCLNPAMAGTPENLTAAGLSYANGWNVETADPELALDYLTRASALEQGAATCALGLFYREGRFVEQDQTRSEQLLLTAMEQGDIGAAWAMASQYAEGHVVVTDLLEANRLRRLAMDFANFIGRVPEPMQIWSQQHPELNRDWLSTGQINWWGLPGPWTMDAPQPDGTVKEVDAVGYFNSTLETFYPERALDD